MEKSKTIIDELNELVVKFNRKFNYFRMPVIPRDDDNYKKLIHVLKKSIETNTDYLKDEYGFDVDKILKISDILID